MANYPLVKIGDVCRIEKGQTGIQSAIPGDYPLVTTALERKNADTYQFDTAAVCIPLVSSTGHGKKTLNYVHFQDGKFALGTILAAVIPNDPKQLNAAYLHQYLQFYKDTKIVPWMKGAANVSLAIRDIAQIEVPLPAIEQQNKFIGIFNRATVFSEQLLQEFNQQSTYLTQLRQTILQEAIEGKLTAGWRDQHPMQPGDPETDAAALLAQIQAEKARLVAEKKIKPEKPLPPIREEEMPFDLPVGWVWCRTSEICEAIVDCPHSTPRFKDDGMNCIDTTCFGESGEITSMRKVDLDTFVKRNARLVPLAGDIVYSREGIIGQAVILPEGEQFCLGQRVMLFRPWQDIKAQMFRLLIVSPYFRNEMVKNHKGMGAKHVNMKDLREGMLPLPPIAEQRAIVERVERLLALVDELAAQVAERKAQADALMQAVLREAFAG